MADKIDMFEYYQSRMIEQQIRAMQQQPQPQFSTGIGQDIGNVALRGWLGSSSGSPQGIGGVMAQPGMSHLGTVREFRRKFKEYTKAEFREMGSQPVIKEILSGMTKLNKEQIQERISEHLAAV